MVEGWWGMCMCVCMCWGVGCSMYFVVRVLQSAIYSQRFVAFFITVSLL